MWNDDAAGDDVTDEPGGDDGTLRRYCVAAAVNDDLIAAVEGWRRAHGLAEQPEALGELVRLGLMSEVAKIYRLVCRDGSADASQAADASQPNTFGKHKRHHRSRRGERREHHPPTN